MKRAATIAILTLLTWLIWSGALSESADSPDTADHTVLLAEVVYVIDGDTLSLDIAGQTERVRLIGIDTPETVSQSVPVQCFGPEASSALTGLLPQGSLVRIERGSEARDRYGRLLLYLHRDEDDLFVNQWLIEGGYADAVSYPPNDEYADVFEDLRNQARAEQRGLWGACDGPDQPLE